MVWFYCDDCGDTIKKPKLANHFRTCHGQTFTCVDCSRSFNRSSAGSHSTCVSEHEKYALGATKPGGYASTGFFKEGLPQPQQAAAANGSEELVGAQFLSERPPWKCSCCNVNCTSRDTLLGHAAGAKHKRRARAALGLSGQQQQQANGTAAADEQPAETPQAAAADATAAAAAAGDKRASSESNTAAEETKQPSSKKQKKHKQSKKDKQDTSVEKKDTVTAAAADKVQTEQLQEKESSKKKVKKNREAAADQQQASEAEAAAVDVLDKDSKKEKKSSDSKQSGKQQQQQQQLPDLAPLLAVAKKKLKKKGKLGFKKLETLLKKNANGGYNEGVVAAVKQQLLAAAEVQLKDYDTLVWQDSN